MQIDPPARMTKEPRPQSTVAQEDRTKLADSSGKFATASYSRTSGPAQWIFHDSSLMSFPLLPTPFP